MLGLMSLTQHHPDAPKVGHRASRMPCTRCSSVLLVNGTFKPMPPSIYAYSVCKALLKANDTLHVLASAKVISACMTIVLLAGDGLDGLRRSR